MPFKTAAERHITGGSTTALTPGSLSSLKNTRDDHRAALPTSTSFQISIVFSTLSSSGLINVPHMPLWGHRDLPGELPGGAIRNGVERKYAWLHFGFASISNRSDRSSIRMALEWVVLGYTAGAEAIMLLFLTLPGLGGLRRGLLTVVRSALKPLLSVVPFCLFLLADIYWKYEMRPTCEQEHSCTPSEHLRHDKSILKSQRNAILIASALLLYWLLFSVTSLLGRIDQQNQRIENLKRSE
ncbi:hypothetical protein B296_00039034 [Ensete ventricosum]|uniref:Endoplasmic reticulum transmembrane protein n=1 Tax=Ensete ventricosum TaxID=4639 RepID=A0A426YSN4_ENSVE|nr:hypothetical protein B296_00039034 [Ensete ventricosum]